jgi:hypothetical protein
MAASRAGEDHVIAENWAEDVRKHAPRVDERAIAGIVRYCGIALRKGDNALVSFRDRAEVLRVRDDFLKKRLGLTSTSDAELEAAIAAIGGALNGRERNSRVTMYYLLAARFGRLSTFV